MENKSKKVEFLQIRIPPDKFNELKEQAGAAGLALAAYARQALFERLAANKSKGV